MKYKGALRGAPNPTEKNRREGSGKGKSSFGFKKVGPKRRTTDPNIKILWDHLTSFFLTSLKSPQLCN